MAACRCLRAGAGDDVLWEAGVAVRARRHRAGSGRRDPPRELGRERYPDGVGQCRASGLTADLPAAGGGIDDAGRVEALATTLVLVDRWCGTVEPGAEDL